MARAYFKGRTKRHEVTIKKPGRDEGVVSYDFVISTNAKDGPLGEVSDSPSGESLGQLEFPCRLKPGESITVVIEED